MMRLSIIASIWASRRLRVAATVSRLVTSRPIASSRLASPLARTARSSSALPTLSSRPSRACVSVSSRLLTCAGSMAVTIGPSSLEQLAEVDRRRGLE